MIGMREGEQNIEHTGHRWQRDFGDFIKKNRPTIVVETGVSEGVSTKFILEAMDAAAHGRLISIDPNPAYTTPHPRWALVKKTSHEALVDLFTSVGPFDVFIHDADHDVECQTFEYSLAWHLVRPGGYIYTDDWSWGLHGAWARFCDAHQVMSQTMGYAAWIQKPANADPCPAAGQVQQLYKEAVELAHAAAIEQGDALRYGIER